jgi:glycosyltransferase involved in cell wall biosynthesis
VSNPLKKHLQKYRSDVNLVYNGVSELFFMKTCGSNILSNNTELDKIPHPIIGYIGYIAYKINFSLLAEIAKKMPQWSIVLIGPNNISDKDMKAYSKLKALLNVHILPEVKPEKVPHYISKMDVCLLPYKSCEQIDYCFPNKFWEYMAIGKPIVSVKWSAIEEYERSGLVKIADTPEESISSIEEMMRKETAELILRRKEMARRNTWDQRVEQISKYIHEAMLNTRQQESMGNLNVLRKIK